MAIKYCGCPPTSRGAAYQERTYGPGMRVCSEKAGIEKRYRCTCCGKEVK